MDPEPKVRYKPPIDYIGVVKRCASLLDLPADDKDLRFECTKSAGATENPECALTADRFRPADLMLPTFILW